MALIFLDERESVALLERARTVGAPLDPRDRDTGPRAVFHFDPHLRRMSTVDTEGGGTVAVQTKGAPETVLPCCTHIAEAGGGHHDLTLLHRIRLAGLRSVRRAGTAKVGDRPPPTR